MPSRLLSDDILTDERVDSLSFGAEVFYRRLFSFVDDFGRFDGRLMFLRARLYPTKLDTVNDKQIQGWLAECVAAGLVTTYEANGKPYLVYHDITGGRSKTSQYPPPPGEVTGPTRANVTVSAFVYFIQVNGERLVKIGSALCPESRLSELQTASAKPLLLLGSVPGGRKFEKELHRRFDALRIRSDGEWFKLEGDLLAFIRDEVPPR